MGSPGKLIKFLNILSMEKYVQSSKYYIKNGPQKWYLIVIQAVSRHAIGFQNFFKK